MAGLFNKRETPGSWAQDKLRKGLLALGMDNYGANKWAHNITRPLLALTPLGGAEDAVNKSREYGAMMQRGQQVPMLGGMDVAMAAPAMFLGVKARGADLAALREATQMRKAGAAREDIWNKTGWFKGVDGKWRFEVDDSGAKLKRGTIDEANLKKRKTIGNSLNHPELYAARPEAANVPLLPGYGMDGYLGDYDGIAGAIRINRTGAAWRDPEQFKSVALHEMQHSIQDAEGFASGGNFDTFAIDPREQIVNDATVIQAFMRKNGQTADEAATAFAAAMGRAPHETSVGYAKTRSNEELMAALYPKKAYLRLAGEVEARNVQTRLPMTADERRATPPWLTQDVADADQIVRRR